MLNKLRSKLRLRTRLRKVFGTPPNISDEVDTIPDPAFREVNQRRLRGFRNKYKGQRCIIIGNGPSLNRMDLRLLEKEYTFGVNGIFYKYDEIGFKPTFYVVEDHEVVSGNLERINSLNYSHKFFPARYHGRIDADEHTIFLPFESSFYMSKNPYYCRPRFSKRCDKVIHAGQTVTYLNLQLAYYMGFKKVYLIGIDFSYVIPKTSLIDGPHIISQEDDPNHFHPDYFGKGKKWHFPKLENCLLSYKHAREIYERSGRKIFNATVGGKLEVFERVDFNSLFTNKDVRD